MSIVTALSAALVLVFLAALVAWRSRSTRAGPTRRRTDGPTPTPRAGEPFGALEFEGRVAEAFRALLAAPRGGFLVVSDGVHYVQAARGAGRDLLVEAVSNEFLPAEARLDASRERALVDLGFAPPGEALNFSKTVDLGEAHPERLARLASDAFRQAFGSLPGGTFEVTLELD